MSQGNKTVERDAKHAQITEIMAVVFHTITFCLRFYLKRTIAGEKKTTQEHSILEKAGEHAIENIRWIMDRAEEYVDVYL